MAEGYSGLRIRRKRVHSAKCSCCCSEDQPPSARKEEGEGNNKTQRATKKGQRGRVLRTDDADENNNSSEDKLPSPDVNKDLQKTPGGSGCQSQAAGAGDVCDVHVQPAKKKVARSRDRGPKNKKTSKTEREDSEAKPAEKLDKSRLQGSSDRRSTRIAKNNQSNATKPKSSNPKPGDGSTNSRSVSVDNTERSLDHNEENSSKNKSWLEGSAAGKKNKNKKRQGLLRGNDNEFQTNNGNLQSGNLSKKKDSGTKKAPLNHEGGGRRSIRSRRVVSVKSGGEEGLRPFGNAQSSDARSRSKVESASFKGDGETAALVNTRGVVQDEGGRTQKKNLPPHSDGISRTKIAVFDHLLEVLRKCPGQDKVTMDNATTFFMGLNVENLSPMVKEKNGRDGNKELDSLDEAIVERHQNATGNLERNANQGSRQNAGLPDVQQQHGQPPNVSQCSGLADEMNLSEAAETLVSIKSNPMSRQDTSNSSSGPANESANDAENLSKLPEQPAAGQLLEAAPFVMQSPVQVVAPSEVLHNTPMSPLPSLGLQQPTVYPQMPLPPLMGALSQFAMAPNAFAPLGQFFNQTSCNPLGVLTTSISVSTAPSTVATRSPTMSVPALLFGGQQPLLSFPPMPVSSSSGVSASSSFVAQTNTVPGTAQPLPLKGMEEVIGNVGANNPSVMWNVKPSPVVYLASPQTLGGVPRNLVPGVTHNTQGIPLGNECSSLTAGLASMPPVAPAVTAASVQRPILPREHVTAAAPALPPSGAALKPATQVTSGAGILTGNNQQGHSGSLRHSVATPGTATQPVGSLGVPTGSATLTPLLTAKQVVKKFVRERTRSAEQRKESSVDETQQPSKPETPLNTLPGNPNTQRQTPSRNPDFNLQQAATTLLSIAVPEGTDVAEGDDSPEEPEEEVVYTSKGMFRVGDVDVDPQYNSIGKEGYTCGKCGKIFTSLSYLARHIKRVCPDMSCRKWKCNRCDKAFRHPFGLQQHIYTHTGERPHKCPECPKAFYSSNDLRRHSRIHSGERPYRCKHCDKTFATTISLKTHTYIHTGEKPHKCPHCPKTFATSSKLGRHIVTHSEQRPYSCDQCPKAFNRSGDLRRHSLHVHEIRDKPGEGDDVTIQRLDEHHGASTETQSTAS